MLTDCLDFNPNLSNSTEWIALALMHDLCLGLLAHRENRFPPATAWT